MQPYKVLAPVLIPLVKSYQQEKEASSDSMQFMTSYISYHQTVCLSLQHASTMQSIDTMAKEIDHYVYSLYNENVAPC